MAPSVTVPNAMARPIQIVTRVGRRSPRRRFFLGWTRRPAPARPPSANRLRVTRTSSTNSAVATAKWAARAEDSEVTPEARSAANSEPALKVACIFAIVVRRYATSSAAACAFIATFRQPTATPSQHMMSRVTG